MTFTDGADFKDWTRLDFDRSKYLAFFGQNVEWKIPLELVKGYDKIKVSIKAGGEKNWNADETGRLEIEL